MAGESDSSYQQQIFDFIHFHHSNDGSLHLAPAILRTCKRIHEEAAPVLYEGNAFHFSIEASPDAAKDKDMSRSCWNREVLSPVPDSLFRRFLDGYVVHA